MFGGFLKDQKLVDCKISPEGTEFLKFRNEICAQFYANGLIIVGYSYTYADDIHLFPNGFMNYSEDIINEK